MKQYDRRRLARQLNKAIRETPEIPKDVRAKLNKIKNHLERFYYAKQRGDAKAAGVEWEKSQNLQAEILRISFSSIIDQTAANADVNEPWRR